MAQNSKSEPEKKGSKFSPKRIASRIGRFFRDFKSECKKVTWPSFKQVRNNTIAVIIAVVVFGIFIWGLDAILSLLVNLLLKNA